MNKKRLLKLADLLEADAKNKKGVKFDLVSWGENRNVDPDRPVPVSCGTTACAVGLACISGAFKDEGLTYARGSVAKKLIVPVFDNDRGLWAAQNFFEIGYGEFDKLFTDTSYPKNQRKGAVGERAVAKRIREMVAAA